MKKYKIGIIGYGGFGKFLHYWWEKLPNVEVVAIADPHKDFTSNENYVVYREWRELIRDENVDIVSIVTPPGLHTEMACEAMIAGKHVLLEKPVAISEEGGLEIIETQKQTGMIITVDHMIRYNPIIQNLVKLTQAGTFGKLRHVVVNNYAQDEALPPEHWFWKREMSGGIFIEHGVHFFDIVNAIGDQHYTEVYGCSDSRNENQRDRVAAMVLYNEGLIANYYHAFSGPGLFEQTSIHLAYDLARVEIEGWMPMKGTVKALVNSQNKEQLENLPGWTVTELGGLNTLSDVSRPEGWGSEDIQPENQAVVCSGITYRVDEMLSGNFEIPQTKGEVYGKCVQSILSDIIQKIENKDHTLTITLEDAFESLKTAVLASK